MKNTGMIRKIDELGRIVIPKETRNVLKINSGDDLEIYVDNDSIVLKKFGSFDNKINSINMLIKSISRVVNGIIIFTDKEKIISFGKYYEIKISDELKNILEDRLQLVSKDNSKCFIDGLNGYYYILPIIQNSDATGLLIFVSDKISNDDRLKIDFLKLIIENI